MLVCPWLLDCLVIWCTSPGTHNEPLVFFFLNVLWIDHYSPESKANDFAYCRLNACAMSYKASDTIYSYNRLDGRRAVSNLRAINVLQLQYSSSSQPATSCKVAFLSRNLWFSRQEAKRWLGTLSPNVAFLLLTWSSSRRLKYLIILARRNHWGDN
jgi:hypothetical protein